MLDEVSTHGIAKDIPDMIQVVLDAANAVVRETDLPDFHVRLKFLFRAEGKGAFDELDGALQRD
jgi:hypothetical protein